MGALSSRARVPGTLAGMKTDALISLCGRLLLALMLAAPAGVALSPSPAMAQAAPAAARPRGYLYPPQAIRGVRLICGKVCQ